MRRWELEAENWSFLYYIAKIIIRKSLITGNLSFTEYVMEILTSTSKDCYELI